jgi:hypothetical protein
VLDFSILKSGILKKIIHPMFLVENRSKGFDGMG